MDLVPISDNEMINVDLIEAITIKKARGQKIFTITIGGKSYTPDLDSTKLLELLIKKGVAKSTNQFFAV